MARQCTIICKGIRSSTKAIWRSAKSEFDQAIALEPEYAMAYYDRGYVRGRLGDHLGAIADLTIAIEADARQISDFYRANAYIDRGNALLYSGRYEEATADCSRAVELFSEPEGKARAYHNRGAVQRLQGNLSEALPDYDRAVDLSPGNAVLLFDRGQLQVELGNLEAAISDFNAVLRTPTSLELQMEAHTHRGKIMIDLGRMKEALADYDAAVKLQPENYSARLIRGALLAEQGMVEEALDDLKMVAASSSNAKEVELAAQLVQRLRSAY